MRLDKLVKATVAALEDIKGRDIVVLDVRRMTALFDKVIVASGDSARQNKALGSHVQEKLKALGATVHGVEGTDTGEWVLVDLGDVVVHIMQPAIRQYYNLEELWGDAAVVPRRRVAGGTR
jgi:ribosome-associated protein